MKSASILIADDEPQIRRVMRATLSAQGYSIVEARDGQEAVVKFRTDRPDLVILDMNMPGLGGLDACREIRSGSSVPIIILTVRSAEKDKVNALDAGADDYVVKPFGIQELLARIRAALRRSPNEQGETAVSSKELDLDFDKRTITVRGNPVHLTPKEFELLRQLALNRGKPITHRRLLQAVWGPDYGEETESLRVVINQLRKKIELDPKEPQYIRTEPWVGYRFVIPEDESGKIPEAIERCNRKIPRVQCPQLGPKSRSWYLNARKKGRDGMRKLSTSLAVKYFALMVLVLGGVTAFGRKRPRQRTGQAAGKRSGWRSARRTGTGSATTVFPRALEADPGRRRTSNRPGRRSQRQSGAPAP